MRNGRNASITEITGTQVITDWLLRKTGAVAWKAGMRAQLPGRGFGCRARASG